MSSAPAVDYALRIIEFFSKNNQPIGIADINNSLGINKNAASRILGALQESGWIYCCDPLQKKYGLTLRPFSIVSKSVSGNSLQRLAKPYMDELFEQTGDCTYLGVKNQNTVIYTLHYNSIHDASVNGRVGGAYPLHCSAAGKILLSWSDGEEINAYFEKHAAARTKNTITELAAFQREANEIKRLHYALDREEYGKGIICIAVPVFDADGAVVAAAGISTLTIYHDEASLEAEKLDLVTAAAEKISAALGYCTEGGNV